jgi:hypothetical protein
MQINWRSSRNSSFDLFVNPGGYQGILSEYGEQRYGWHNSPHKSTDFTAETLEEAKQIAQAIWALQESIGGGNGS